MKLTAHLRSFLALTSSALLTISYAHATNLYWDGATSGGAPGGGAGTWNLALTNWDSSLAGADVAWVNANLDTAVFGGTASTSVVLGSNIDVGGLRFDTTGYGITTTGFSLNFAAANNSILFNNIAAATITGPVGGSGNVIISTSNPATAGTLTLNGTSTGGWSGTTTINAGMTLALAADNQALNSTTGGITLNGGNITLTNTSATAVTNNRVNNSAITSNGGTFTYTNTSGAGVYAETIGTVDLARGQTVFALTTNQSGAGSQTLTLGTAGSGLTRSGTTSAVSFGSASGLNITKNIIQVFGATGSGSSGSTASVQIIGPWASYGTTPSAPTDYAVYDTSGRVLNANISATAENSTQWTAGGNNVTLSGATTLTGTRTLNTLRYTGGALALGLGASNFNLETYGLLNGGGTLTISTTGTGGLTTPSGGGNLYLTTGAAAITVSAPIKDNGGAVTVVKSGSSTLTLSGTNTFSGGLVLNAGTLTTTSDANLGTGGVTVNGTVTWGAGLGTKRSITINEGGVLTLNGTTNGVYSGLLSGGGALASSVSNVFHFTNAGNSLTGQVNPNYAMFFANIGDSSNAINIGNTNGNGGFGWIGGTKTLASRVFTLNATGNGYITANGSGALTIQQNLAISGTAGTRTLNLIGNSSAINTFSGNIADGIDGGASVVSLSKNGAGTWALGGTNTYSGTTTLAAAVGPLIFQGSQAVSPNTSFVLQQNSTPAFVLRLLNDSNVSLGNTFSLDTGNTSMNGIIFVGNNNTANGGSGSGTDTNKTITLGKLAATGLANNRDIYGFKAEGANGYTLGINNIEFPIFTAATFTSLASWKYQLIANSAPISITGTVQQLAGSTSATLLSPTLELSGTNTGSAVSGAIKDSLDGSPKLLKVTKTGTGTWNLSGTNTYTGTTTISAGLLRITGNSSAATGAVSVTAGALGGNGGNLGGAVTVSSTGGIDLRDNTVGNLTLASTLGITGALGANNLSFDLGNGTSTSDSILAAGTTTVTTTGSAVVNLNQLNGVAGRSTFTYTLIGGAGTLDLANFNKFSLATTKAFGQTYALVHDLVSDGGTGNLQVSATNVTSATAAAFWAGGGNNWSTSGNWRSTVAGGGAVAGAPDYQTNVTFSTTAPGPANLTTNVLDVDFDINSLTLTNASGNVTIGGTKTLTIEAAAVNGNALGNGIDSQKTTGTNTISSKVGLASSQSWTVASGGTLSVSGVVSDFGAGYSLTKAGAGTLVLSGVNTFTGATNITDGTLRLDNASSLAGTSGVSITSGASLRIAGVSPTFSANQSLTLNGSGNVGSAGALVIATSGTTTWNGPVSLGSNSLVRAGGGTGLTIGGAVTLGSSTLTVQNASTTATTISGAISGSGGLTKEDTGTGGLILTGANTYTGTTAINAGTLSLAPSANTLGGVLLATSAVTLSQAATLTFNPATLLKSDTGGYSLAAPITLTGGAGTANIRFGAGAVGNDFKYVLGGSVTGQSGVAQTLALFQGGGGGAGDRQNVLISGALADGASGGTLAVTVDFAGASTAAQNAFVNLTGQSTFTGNLIVNNSKLMNAGSGYAGAWLTIGGERWVGNGTNPGSLETVGTGTLGTGGVYNGNITINTGNGISSTGITTLSFLSSANQTLGGTISGAGNLRQDGTGSLKLTGTNNYTGTTVVSAGTMQFTKQASLYNATDTSWTAANINVKSGATFAVNVDDAGTAGFTATKIDTLLTNISVANTAAQGLQAGATLGFDTSTDSDGTFTQGNAIANSTGANGGTIGVTKLGTGTLIFDETNTYTGATTVNAGTLLINGSTVAGSTVSVASGATLGGTGTIGGAVNVTGSLSPGASIETLGSGTLSFANGSSLIHELDSSVATSVGSDLMKVTGNLNLVGTVGLNLSDIAVTDVAFNVGNIFSLINYTGTWNNGLFTFSGNELADDEVFSFGLNTWQISYNDATGGLNYTGEYAGTTDSFVNLTVMTVIPEPRTALLGGLGLLMLLRRRRQ